MSTSSAAANAAPTSNAKVDFWNPTQYLLFDELRARPGVDMTTRILATLERFGQTTSSVRRIVDLGCGTGKLALQLAQKFPIAAVTGVDSSANMLQTAQSATTKLPEEVQARVAWKQAGFQEFNESDDEHHTADGVDLIFSNAALHWSHEHATLFPHLMKQLRAPGGILAVQMPNNFRAPSHLLMLQALKDGSFLTPERIDEVWANQPDVHIDGAQHYYHLLAPHARHIDVWQTESMQPVSSTTAYHPVLEWIKSTALAPILTALPSDAERTRFQEIYSALLEKAYPYFDGRSGRQVLFPFKRIFILAVA